MNVRFFAGFLLAMGGLVVVGIGAESDGMVASLGEASLFGDFLALLATLVWAVYSVYSVLVQKIASLGYETISSTKRTFLWELVFMVPISMLFDGSLVLPEVLLQWDTVLNLLFLGVVASLEQARIRRGISYAELTREMRRCDHLSMTPVLPPTIRTLVL